MYLRDLGARGPQKIRDRWSSVRYCVLGVPQEGGSIYTIAAVDDETRVRRVHHSMLKAEQEDPTGCISFNSLQPQEALPPEEEPSFECDLLVLGQPSPGTVPTRPPDQSTASQVPPPAPADESYSLVAGPGSDDMGLCRTTRQTAGQHSNVHHLPRSAGSVHIANSISVSASNSVSAFF